MADLLSPITLVGIGRSGTTLLENVFKSCEDVYATGETGGLIFGTYIGSEASFFHSPILDYSNREVYKSSVVRALFDKLFPINDNNYKHWFHKPAGIPKFIPWKQYREESDNSEFPVTWYWHVMNEVFPNSKYICVLRNPWEIVISRVVFSGWKEEGGWEDIKILYDILNYNKSNIYFVFYEDIKNNPKKEILKLLGELAIEPPENLDKILEKKYVPTDVTKLKEAYSIAKGPNYSDLDYENITKIWNEYGREFSSPEGKQYFF